MKDKNIMILIGGGVLLLLLLAFWIGRTTVQCQKETRYVNDPKQIIKEDSLKKVITVKDSQLVYIFNSFKKSIENHNLQKPVIKRILETKHDTVYLFTNSAVAKYIGEADSIIDLQDSALTVSGQAIQARDSLIDFMRFNAELNNFEKQDLQNALGKSEKKRIQNKTAWKILGTAAILFGGVAVIK